MFLESRETCQNQAEDLALNTLQLLGAGEILRLCLGSGMRILHRNINERETLLQWVNMRIENYQNED